MTTGSNRSYDAAELEEMGFTPLTEAEVTFGQDVISMIEAPPEGFRVGLKRVKLDGRPATVIVLGEDWPDGSTQLTPLAILVDNAALFRRLEPLPGADEGCEDGCTCSDHVEV
jgi:hypothetical protein